PAVLAVPRTFDLGDTLPSGTAASAVALPVSPSATREAISSSQVAAVSSQAVTTRRSRTPVWIVGGAIVIAVAMVVTAAATRGGASEAVKAAAPVATGSLEVTSEPTGAQVIIDGS